MLQPFLLKSKGRWRQYLMISRYKRMLAGFGTPETL